ncbi:MAG: hypothetical protein ABSD71_15220 [Bacteroidales bacterium]|jgi:hypothetical protein
MKVADKPFIYLGYAGINYNNTANHTLAADAWKILNVLQKQHNAEAIK